MRVAQGLSWCPPLRCLTYPALSGTSAQRLICVNNKLQRMQETETLVTAYGIKKGSTFMTQHLSMKDTLDDRRAMRRLALIVGCFLALTAAMAVGVGIVMG